MAHCSRPKDYLGEVEENTILRIQCSPKEIVYNLMMCRRGTPEEKINALLGKVRLAKHGKATRWLVTVAQEAVTLQFQSHASISENIHVLPKKKRAIASIVLPTASVDYRKKTDPTITSVVVPNPERCRPSSVQQQRSSRKSETDMGRRMERRQPCLIPECDIPNAYPKSHAFQHHIPNLFKEGRELEEVTRKRVAALKRITGWLLGNRAKLEDLVKYINSTKQVPRDSNWEVSNRLKEEMEDMSQELFQELPERFVISQMNSLAALIHWRVLIVIIAKLEPRHRQSLMEQSPVKKRVPSEKDVDVDLYPKDVGEVTDDTLKRMESLLQMPEVVGLGEVGIDHTVSPEFWGSQLRILNSALSFLRDRHVLIIHCRSMTRTGDTSEAFMTLLFHLQHRVRKKQNIHLHCFTGSDSMVKEWTSVFPNTYFGFTRLVDRFDEAQLRGLRAVQDGRILLETDAQYFQFSGGNSKPKFRHGTRYSAPILIGMTVAVVAEGRQEDQVLCKPVANARVLYGGQRL